MFTASQTWLDLSGGWGFDPPRQMVDNPTKSQKKTDGVVNEPRQGPSHLTIIQQPTMNIGWLCSYVVCSVVTDCINNVVMLDLLAVIPERKLRFPGRQMSLVIE